LDYPNVGGPSPKVRITVVGENVQYFRGHSLTVEGQELPWVAASGCEGLTSIRVHTGKAELNQKCQVKLYFAEPGDVSEGDRVFDVTLQGKSVLKEFDIRKNAGSRNRVVVRSFDDVAVNEWINVTFTPRSGRPLLCGVEVVLAEN
jgi:hypothetical protein